MFCWAEVTYILQFCVSDSSGIVRRCGRSVVRGVAFFQPVTETHFGQKRHRRLAVHRCYNFEGFVRDRHLYKLSDFGFDLRGTVKYINL